MISVMFYLNDILEKYQWVERRLEAATVLYVTFCQGNFIFIREKSGNFEN